MSATATGQAPNGQHPQAQAAYDPHPDEIARVPPHDLGAEQSVLGGMLLSRDAIGDATEILRARDFYRPAHATVFEVTVGLADHGDPTDVISVAAELTRRGLLEKVGGAGYIHTLVSTVPTAANTGYYARIVAEKAILRRLADAGTMIVQRAFGPGEVADIADAASAALNAALDVHRDSDPVTLAPGANAALDRWLDPTSDPPGLPTGFLDLDALLHGLRPGQYVVIAGRPGTGKTTLAMGIARHVAIRLGQTVMVDSLEMERTEIEDSNISAESRVPLEKYREGRLDSGDRTAVTDTIAGIADAPLFIDDSPDLTVMGIRAKARRIKQRHGLALIILDYLQLISRIGRRAENRQQEVAEMSRSLKLLAKELHVPILVLSQLNRASESRADKKPQLSDLRDSGQIEQDADVVILLDDAEAELGVTDLVVAKNRRGRRGTVQVANLLHVCQFASLTNHPAGTGTRAGAAAPLQVVRGGGGLVDPDAAV